MLRRRTLPRRVETLGPRGRVPDFFSPPYMRAVLHSTSGQVLERFRSHCDEFLAFAHTGQRPISYRHARCGAHFSSERSEAEDIRRRTFPKIY